MRTPSTVVLVVALVYGAPVHGQVDNCAELLRLSRTTSRTIVDQTQFTRNVDNFCSEVRSARRENRSLNLDLRVLGLGQAGGSNATTNSAFTKYCSEESNERRNGLNYQGYLEGIEPGAYAAYDRCTRAAANGVQFQMLMPVTRDALELVVYFRTSDGNARAHMSWSGSRPVRCRWESFSGDGTLEAPERRILAANERTRLKCERDSYNAEPFTEPDYVNVIRDGGDATINVSWSKYNEQGEPVGTIDEIRRTLEALDAEVARLRSELERQPDRTFGDWQAVVAGEVHRAAADGIVIAHATGPGCTGMLFELQTGEAEDRLVRRTRGGRCLGAATPVKRGHFYQARVSDGRGALAVYWLPYGE